MGLHLKADGYFKTYSQKINFLNSQKIWIPCHLTSSSVPELHNIYVHYLKIIFCMVEHRGICTVLCKMLHVVFAASSQLSYK
jgi:hypothetical protein